MMSLEKESKENNEISEIDVLRAQIDAIGSRLATPYKIRRPKFLLRAKDSFDAAHHLPFHKGKCKEQHGHTYNVEYIFEFDDLDDNGIAQDFDEIKDVTGYIKKELDHKDLNVVFSFTTTVEHIAQWIYEHLKRLDIPIFQVTLWETAKYGVSYGEY